MAARYAGYDVLAKWDTPAFNDATRRALAERLALHGRRFFTQAEFDLIHLVAERLVPQPDRPEPIPLAALLDDYFAEGRAGGYRLDGVPHLPEAWRIGLAGVAAEAERRHHAPFAALSPEARDEVLAAVQAGDVDPAAWRGVDPALFFRNTLLKIAVGLYYAHPAAWSEIGFGGPASPQGYVRLGPDDRDPWEAAETRP